MSDYHDYLDKIPVDENKKLKQRIADLEARNNKLEEVIKDMTETLESIAVLDTDIPSLLDRFKESAEPSLIETMITDTQLCRETLSKYKVTIDKIRDQDE